MRVPPVKACGVSHQLQRRLQPLRRTSVHGRPAKLDLALNRPVDLVDHQAAAVCHHGAG